MARAHVDDTPPTDLNIDNGAPISTAVSLTVASNRTLYAWWFWVPTTNSGTYTLELYEITGDDDPGPAAGTLLASKAVAAAAVTAGQYNRVNLDTPVDVVSTKAYRANRHSSSGRYVRTAGAFASAGISNAGITLIQSGTNPNGQFAGVLRNGTFREAAAGNYPSQAFLTADYHIDVDDESDAVTPITGALAATTTSPTGALTATHTLSFSGALAATTGSPTGALRAQVTNPAPPTFTAPGLLDMMRENAWYRQEETRRRAAPIECPVCGWAPLQERDGVYNCPTGDYRS